MDFDLPLPMGLPLEPFKYLSQSFPAFEFSQIAVGASVRESEVVGNIVPAATGGQDIKAGIQGLPRVNSLATSVFAWQSGQIGNKRPLGVS